MRDAELTGADEQLIGRCLYEAANGPYFPDWEFGSLIGADRSAVRKVAAKWLSGDLPSRESRTLTLSVLNNLLGYPHDRGSELERAVGAEISRVRGVYEMLKR